MLYLTRKSGESVIINDTIEVTILEVKGRTVRLGFQFPPEANILRKELHDKIRRENHQAAAGGDAQLILEALRQIGEEHFDAPAPPHSPAQEDDHDG